MVPWVSLGLSAPHQSLTLPRNVPAGGSHFIDGFAPSPSGLSHAVLMMLWELDVEAWSDSGGVVQAGVCFMGEVGTGSLTNTPWEAGKSAPPPPPPLTLSTRKGSQGYTRGGRSRSPTLDSQA